jgi:hypothetical protein
VAAGRQVASNRPTFEALVARRCSKEAVTTEKRKDKSDE